MASSIVFTLSARSVSRRYDPDVQAVDEQDAEALDVRVAEARELRLGELLVHPR
jgi:hypothetical protein